MWFDCRRPGSTLGGPIDGVLHIFFISFFLGLQRSSQILYFIADVSAAVEPSTAARTLNAAEVGTASGSWMRC
jgi:hypothetical protein